MAEILYPSGKAKFIAFLVLAVLNPFESSMKVLSFTIMQTAVLCSVVILSLDPLKTIEVVVKLFIIFSRKFVSLKAQ